MIDVEKVAMLLVACFVVAAVYAMGRLSAPETECPVPTERVCYVRADLPAADGGRMLTVHCQFGGEE